MKISYIILTQAWYANAAMLNVDYIEEVSVIVDAHDGNYEFAIRNYDHGRYGTAWRVEVFDDAWKAFQDIPLFFVNLASLTGEDDIDVTDIVNILIAMDAKDITPRRNPAIRRNGGTEIVGESTIQQLENADYVVIDKTEYPSDLFDHLGSIQIGEAQ